jgi:cell wall-associated NlpC family hydrolase
MVNDVLAALLEERGLDARTCYTRVAPLPPDGSDIEVECSDAGVADELRRRLAPAGENGGRVRVSTLPAGRLPEGLIAASSVADVRREPSHPSELVTQIVYGDAVTPLKSEGEWFLVRADDGYIGWVRSWHLAESSAAEQADFRARSTHRVVVNHSQAFADPAIDSLPVSDLVIGIPVVITGGGGRGWVEVELPDGKQGYVPGDHLQEHPRPGPVSPASLAATGLRFLGIPYLWGGNTPKGFDCSGLVQRVFRLHGVILPRDSDQQARVGRERPAGDASRLVGGDLVFFGREPTRITHVGLVLPDRRFLHAYGQVRVNSLDPSDPEYAPELAPHWRLTRDPLAR